MATKKFIKQVVGLILLFCVLTACGNSGVEETDSLRVPSILSADNTPTPASQPTDTPIPTNTPLPEPPATQEPTEEPLVSWMQGLSYEEILTQTRDFQAQRQFSNANEGFTWLVEQDPTFREGYSALAQNAFRFSNYDEAAAFALTAVAIDPADDLTSDPVQVGMAYYLLGQNSSYLREDFTAANFYYSNAIELDPTLHIAKVEHARSVIFESLFDDPYDYPGSGNQRREGIEAAVAILGAIADSSLDKEGLIKKKLLDAHIALYYQDYAGALNLATEASDLSPNDGGLVAFKAFMMSFNDRFSDQDVLEVFQYGVNELGTASPLANFYAAEFVHGTYGDEDNAAGLYLSATSATVAERFGFYPKFSILQESAEKLLSFDYYQDAYNAYYFSLQDYHWNPIARHGAIQGMRGVLFSTGETEAFEDMIDTVIEDFPSAAIAYTERARYLMQTDSFEAAMRDVSYAIELDPALPESYWIRGQLFDYADDRESAIQDYQYFVKYAEEDDLGTNLANQQLESLLAGGATYYQGEKEYEQLTSFLGLVGGTILAAAEASREYRNSEDYVPYTGGGGDDYWVTCNDTVFPVDNGQGGVSQIPGYYCFDSYNNSCSGSSQCTP